MKTPLKNRQKKERKDKKKKGVVKLHFEKPKANLGLKETQQSDIPNQLHKNQSCSCYVIETIILHSQASNNPIIQMPKILEWRHYTHNYTFENDALLQPYQIQWIGIHVSKIMYLELSF